MKKHDVNNHDVTGTNHEPVQFLWLQRNQLMWRKEQTNVGTPKDLDKQSVHPNLSSLFACVFGKFEKM